MSPDVFTVTQKQAVPIETKEDTMTERIAPPWGLTNVAPENARAVWGARLIAKVSYTDGAYASVERLGDRQGFAPDPDRSEEVKKLHAWLSTPVAYREVTGPRKHGKQRTRKAKGSILAAAMEQVKLNLLDYTMSGSESKLVTLYEDERGVIVGDTRASHGYCYVAAWMKEA